MTDVIYRNVTLDGEPVVLRNQTSPLVIPNSLEHQFEVWVSRAGKTATAGAPAVASVPDQMAEPQWDALVTGIQIRTAPNSDPEITDYQYRVNGGAATSLGTALPGFVAVTYSLTDTVQVRALNAEGPATEWSDTKTVGNQLLYIPPMTLGVFTERWRTDRGKLTMTGTPARARMKGFSEDLSGRIFWSLDEIDGVSLASVADAEIAAVVQKNESSLRIEFGLVMRGGGSASSETAVASRIFDSPSTPGTQVHQITGYNAGAATSSDAIPPPDPVVNGVPWVMRARATGGTFQHRAWLSGDPEPAAWQETVTEGVPAAPGRVGLFIFNSKTSADYYSFGVGLNGARAPLPL